MKYQTSIVILGIAVLILPFIHVPQFWNIILHLAVAILIILVGLSIRQQRSHKKPKTKKVESDS